MSFGYVYAFAEPAIYILTFVLFRQFLGTGTPFGDNAVVFLLTAILTFRTAIGLTRRTLGAIHSNMALLTFPQVKTFDVIVARIVLEGATWTVTAIIFVFGLFIFADLWAIKDLESILEGYLATMYLGASFGFFNATFVRLFPYWEKILQFAYLPLFILSGVFFLPQTLPPDILAYLWWNPFLHSVEWVRSGVYLDYTPYLSKFYLLSFSTSLLFLGVFINAYFKRHMMND